MRRLGETRRGTGKTTAPPPCRQGKRSSRHLISNECARLAKTYLCFELGCRQKLLYRRESNVFSRKQWPAVPWFRPSGYDAEPLPDSVKGERPCHTHSAEKTPKAAGRLDREKGPVEVQKPYRPPLPPQSHRYRNPAARGPHHLHPPPSRPSRESPYEGVSLCMQFTKATPKHWLPRLPFQGKACMIKTVFFI